MAMTYRDNGKDVRSGTQVERLAFTIPPIEDNYEENIYWIEPNGDEYRIIEGAWIQTKAAGAALTTPVSSTGVAQGFDDDASKVSITPKVSGLSHNREFSAVTVRQSITWVEGFQPTEQLSFVIDPDGSAFVCFDAPNDAVADAWLADAGSSSTDSMRHYIADETLKPNGNVFTFPNVPLSRVDIIRISGTLTKVYVEAL